MQKKTGCKVIEVVVLSIPKPDWSQNELIKIIFRLLSNYKEALSCNSLIKSSLIKKFFWGSGWANHKFITKILDSSMTQRFFCRFVDFNHLLTIPRYIWSKSNQTRIKQYISRPINQWTKSTLFFGSN